MNKFDFNEIKVEFEPSCAILAWKGESIFIAGRIANKTQFLRPNRCVAAERTTEYELWQSASRQQNPRKPPRKRLDAGTACSRSWNFSVAASRIGKRTAQSGSRPLGTPVERNGSQQRFPAERLFWKQYIGLQDAGWPQEKIAATKANRRKWAVLLLKQYVLVLYSDENTCYNIAMAQVSVAQEGELPEMH